MPELPEVQTTVDGLNKRIIDLTIIDVWTNYNSPYWTGSKTIKDPKYFTYFKTFIVGRKIISAKRRAKNILISITGGATIIVHMKMTGHLMYGMYEFDTKDKKDPWKGVTPLSLKDPFNRHVRFILKFANGKYLALSDVRKFAKVALVEKDSSLYSDHLKNIGPEPLEKSFAIDSFKERLMLKKNGKIKQVLLDQSVIAGIGNIYADESLWRAGIHPLQQVKDIDDKKLKELFKAIQQTLLRGIDFGGDSTSDYRDIDGNRGTFHEQHHAYQRTGDTCDKKGCKGKIVRIVVGSRGTHFCNMHQKLDT